MKIIIPKQFDHVFNAPEDWKPSRDGECSALPVRCVLLGNPDKIHTIGLQSFWRPTEEELAILNEGGAVTLIVCTRVHPVVSIGAEHVEEQRLPKEILGG